jgi:hypothetical protein
MYISGLGVQNGARSRLRDSSVILRLVEEGNGLGLVAAEVCNGLPGQPLVSQEPVD